MASYTKKSRSADPSYKRVKSTAPDTQLTYPVGRVTPLAAGRQFEIVVPQLLSANGHRLYRQHGCYQVKVNLLDGNAQAEVKVYALANHWFVKRSIQQAKAIYDAAVSDERAVATEGRWNDFRIGSESGFELLGTLLQSAPVSTATGALTSAGEYLYSRIRDAAGVTKDFRLNGPSGAGGYNVFEEYDNMGNTARHPQQASPATVGAYDGAVETVDEQNMADLVIRGNDPPYDSTNLRDQVFVQVGSLYHDPVTGAQRLSTGFFPAPLGFVWLDYGTENRNPTLELELKSGKYKGVHMEAY
jgi:hypothetical protein